MQTPTLVLIKLEGVTEIFFSLVTSFYLENIQTRKHLQHKQQHNEYTYPCSEKKVDFNV